MQSSSSSKKPFSPPRIEEEHKKAKKDSLRHPGPNSRVLACPLTSTSMMFHACPAIRGTIPGPLRLDDAEGKLQTQLLHKEAPPYTIVQHYMAYLGGPQDSQFSRAAGCELEKHGIRVNCVSTSGVSAPMAMSGMSAVRIKDLSEVEALTCSVANLRGIALKAEHVAEAALFLAFVGHNLAVNGGFTVIDNSIAMTQMLMKQLDGKVAILTGAASGIGEAAAKLFVENGAFVVVADIQEELGLKYGTLDIMYSNAGIMGPMEDMEDGFDPTMAVNLRGPALCIKHAARAMVKRQVRGSIICTASTTSVLGGMGPIAYNTSKHGLVGLVRAAVSELGKHGIRVNCVSPYFVATPLAILGMSAMGINNASGIESLASSTANLKGVALKAKHIAEAALFLASD
ncbi:hypothetical protein RHGRI_018061 [Rhododendron griersonianum]|uniref:Uncharacterized protein n=1 Tax=Rhododendron griersonianum TaxID=479676 RepID=A0AAV6K039_9ERIC|nr:hypothetical protein RHGRI_018061 [Rhododendron griersonianum]